MHLSKYDELYVISDIHMGGSKTLDQDFQVFNHGTRLAKFILYLAESRPKDDVCLILNGDIIDSLAEDQVKGYVALDHTVIVNVLERIYNDPSFVSVWNALAEYIKKPRRHLVFIVGNHDIELSLPCVEASIRNHLAGKDARIQSRLIFSSHGSGFACFVGNKRVFCTHGNEVDDWNMVNYNQLGQLGNAMNAGRLVDSDGWKPNAGTRLVVDAMNKIKRNYPFVDLLKPETEPLFGVLLTLDSKALKNIDFFDAFPIFRDKIKGRWQRKKLLSTETGDFSEVGKETLANEAMESLLGSHLKKVISLNQQNQINISENDLLVETEEAIAQGKSVYQAEDEEAISGELGWGDIVAGKIGLIDKVEALRNALKDWLAGDDTFEIKTEDDTYKLIIKRIGSEVDFVITGHTHLARAIKVDAGCFYFNSGTWIRLLRLTKEVLSDSANDVFKKTVWRAFSSGKMSDLDSAEIPGEKGEMVSLVYDRTHAVRISDQQGAVKGELLLVTGGNNESDEIQLIPEFDSTQ